MSPPHLSTYLLPACAPACLAAYPLPARLPNCLPTATWSCHLPPTDLPTYTQKHDMLCALAALAVEIIVIIIKNAFSTQGTSPSTQPLFLVTCSLATSYLRGKALLVI